ncbi:MAG: FixH family protein [Chitinophagaceae bacterium]|nr:FixH family protein [Chitinophagaceae bacterium]
MNWGYKILFVYLAFVAGIVVMVFKSSSQKIDLVTEDYYAKELKYQDRIDAINRSNALSAPVKYEVVNQQMIISFPKEFAEKKISVTVVLYCPSDDRKDITKEFVTSNAVVTADIQAVKKVRTNCS